MRVECQLLGWRVQYIITAQAGLFKHPIKICFGWFAVSCHNFGFGLSAIRKKNLRGLGQNKLVIIVPLPLLFSVLLQLASLDKNIHYSTVAPFYPIWSRERAKYDTVLHCIISYFHCSSKFLAKWQEKCSGLIKPFNSGWFNIIICANILLVTRISGIFLPPFGARKKETQIAKYPRVLMFNQQMVSAHIFSKHTHTRPNAIFAVQ